MKFFLTKYLPLFLVGMLIFTGCKKKKDDIVRIQSVVPQKIIDALKAKGMLINDGTNPPNLQDAFVMSPYTLKSPYGPEDGMEIGYVVDDYYYKFYDQNNKNEIKYDFHNNGSDQGKGEGAFIAGDGQKFTIFSEETGESQGVKYKNVTIMSGELSSGSIKNFQFAFVVKEKTGDDYDDVLIPVETGRLWYDSDFFSEKTDNFRLAADVKSGKTSVHKSKLSTH